MQTSRIIDSLQRRLTDMEGKKKSKAKVVNDPQWNKCTVEQLNQIGQRVQQELQFYQTSLDTFQALRNECSKNEDVARRLKYAVVGHEGLLPLTGTMYVEGRLIDPSRLIVNIGADYFAEISNDQAMNFYRRKIDFLGQKVIELRALAEQSRATQLQIMSVLKEKQEAQTR